MTKHEEFAKELDKIFSGNIDFIFGSNTAGDLPPEKLPEFAFIGKSNVGKSSLINSFTSRKALARVSHTPGRTRQINFFKVRDLFYLVDLPGYGYAKVSKTEHKNWEKTIIYYLEKRSTLNQAFVLIDSRHGIKEHDKQVLNMLEQLNINYWVIYTKSDKTPQKDYPKLVDDIHKLTRNSDTKVIFTNNKNYRGTLDLKAEFYKSFLI